MQIYTYNNHTISKSTYQQPRHPRMPSKLPTANTTLQPCSSSRQHSPPLRNDPLSSRLGKLPHYPHHHHVEHPRRSLPPHPITKSPPKAPLPLRSTPVLPANRISPPSQIPQHIHWRVTQRYFLPRSTTASARSTAHVAATRSAQKGSMLESRRVQRREFPAVCLL